jgi:TonB family protein
MNELLDLGQTDLHHRREILGFQAICSENRVRCGRPDDLFAFSWQISHDPSLERAVTAFVQDLQRQETPGYTFTEILSILLLGIGGSDAANAETHSPTSLLTSLLVNIGGWSGRDLEEATHLEDNIRIELAQDRFQNEESFSTPSPSPPQPPAKDPESPSPSLDSQELNEQIARLEHINLELRQRLESIDLRVRRMEPHRDTPSQNGEHPSPSATELAVVTPATPSTSERYSRLAATQARTEAYAGTVASPEASAPPDPPSPAPLSPAHTPNPPRTRFLTDEEHRADEKRISAPHRRRRLVQAAVFASALAVTTGTILYTSLRHHRTTNIAAPAAIKGSEPNQLGSSATPDTASARSGSIGSDALPEAPDTLSPPPSHITIYSAPNGDDKPAPSRSHKQTARQSPEAGRDHPGKSGTTASAAPIVSPGGASRESQPLSVSSTIMTEHLISSKPPSYPRLAILTHIQGVVVLKTTIARDGTVQHVQALGGNYLLRDAATNAVRTWRYRPYLLNGKPVEVATLVTVDFALHR